MESLRRGFSTGACAAASATASAHFLAHGSWPEGGNVGIVLPGGRRVDFTFSADEAEEDFAAASVIKDAGDDPDVTHGACVRARVRLASPTGDGFLFRAGEGVGIVRLEGLPIGVGEPAINPAPRRYIADNVRRCFKGTRLEGASVEIEISIIDGARIALKTWNGRLGIEGGLSVLGTSGIVIPYSCAAWIHAIHRGVDVIRAAKAPLAGAACGKRSDLALQKELDLSPRTIIDMGNFVGATLKYVRSRAIGVVVIAGGVGKLAKLAQGHLDLHSARSSVDLAALSRRAAAHGAPSEVCAAIASGVSVRAACLAWSPLARLIVEDARLVAQRAVGEGTRIGVAVVDDESRFWAYSAPSGSGDGGEAKLGGGG